MTPERRFFTTHPRTHEFLKVAMTDGAHQKKPPGVPEEVWVRQRNLVGSYYAFPTSLEKLSGVHGVTRERVRNIITRGVRHLWQNSSPETRRRFPFSKIKIGKQSSVRPLESYPGDSQVIQAARLKAEGKRAEAIKAELGLSTSEFYRIRQTLGREGIELGYSVRSKHFKTELAKKLRKARTDEEIQSLFPQVSIAFLRREDSSLISLFRAARESGFHFPQQKSDQLLAVVQASGLPLGVVEREVCSGQETVVQRYYFIARQHQRRLVRLLRQDETTRLYFRHPVELNSGD